MGTLQTPLGHTGADRADPVTVEEDDAQDAAHDQDPGIRAGNSPSSCKDVQCSVS